MEITREKISDQHVKLSVKVVPEDYREQVKEVLKDYAKRANLKGFRKGKVPLSVVRRMYGKGVVFEELNKVISKGLNDYIETEKLSLVGDPLPVTTDVEFDESSERDYDFEYELGLAPEFEIDYGLAGENSMFNVSIDDDTLEKEIGTLQSTYGPMSNPDESQEGDILFGKLSQVDADGNVIEEGFQKMFTMNAERVQNDDLKKEMANGKKVEDTLSVTMEDVMRNDNEIRRFWETNVKNEKVRDITDEDMETVKAANFQFEVRKINRTEKMEIGQELFDKAFGEGNITTEEDFQARVKSDMELFFERESKRFYRSKTIQTLIEGMVLPLPDDFLKRWLVQTREQITEENIGELYETYIRSLTWKLMVEKMQNENPSLKVEEADLRAKAEANVRQQFGAMLGDGNEERLSSFVDYYLQDEKLSGRMFDELIEEKVFSHLEEKNPPATEDITAAEFLEKLKAEN